MLRLAVVLILLALPATAQTTADRLDALGAMPCPDSDLTCVTIPMPLDRGMTTLGTIDITFGVLPARGEEKAIVVMATGGPGTSGLALADGYLSVVEPEVLDQVTYVFFDQRGIGPTHGLTCPNAEAASVADTRYTLQNLPLSSEIAATYARDCVAEMTNPDILPFVGTINAVADLETFRQAIGAPPIWVYGESYGTQFAQTYALTYPEGVAGIILDGVVDLSLTLAEFNAEVATSSEHILDRILASCDADPVCAGDMGKPAGQVYADLLAQLQAGPVTVGVPQPDGTVRDRVLTDAMLHTITFNALYSPGQRTDLIEALGSAASGQLVPMVRQYDASLYLDPDTLAPIPDPSWFGAAYYAINCADYAPETAQEVIDETAAFVAQAPRLAMGYFTDRITCAHWPVPSNPPDLPEYTGGDWPTLILNGDADPITPITMSYRILDRSQNAGMIAMEGGPHVIWGRGINCPDQIMDDAILGIAPIPSGVSLCTQDLTGEYQDRSAPDPADALAVLSAVEGITDNYPELANWSVEEPVVVGCDNGGRMKLVPAGENWTYAFLDCALWPGIVMNGSGRWNGGADGPGDGFHLDVTVSGAATGDVTFARDTWTDATSLTGTWNGTDVGVTRPMP